MVNTTRNEYRPDFVSAPGETLQEILDSIGMSQAELARRTGRPDKTINEIIKGKATITPETALQLERVLDISAGFWLRREQHYRESLARLHEEEDLATKTDWLAQFPIPEMVKKGWIDHFDDAVEQLKALLNFFGISSPDQWKVANYSASFRQSAAYQIDPMAVAAWLRKGELEAQKIQCAPFNRSAFKNALIQARRLTAEPPAVFIPRLQEMCAEGGVVVVFVPQLDKTRASGATRWLAPDKALIQLSFRYRTDDQLWFTFFHEAGHILLHGKRDAFLEVLNDDTAYESEEEEKADRFAADFLISPEDMRTLKSLIPQGGKYISLDTIQEFARDIGIAPGIVVGRLHYEGLLPYSHGNKLRKTLRWPDE